MVGKLPARSQSPTDSSEPGPQFSQIPSEPHTEASTSQAALEIERIIIFIIIMIIMYTELLTSPLPPPLLGL